MIVKYRNILALEDKGERKVSTEDTLRCKGLCLSKEIRVNYLPQPV